MILVCQKCLNQGEIKMTERQALASRNFNNFIYSKRFQFIRHGNTLRGYVGLIEFQKYIFHYNFKINGEIYSYNRKLSLLFSISNLRKLPECRISFSGLMVGVLGVSDDIWGPLRTLRTFQGAKIIIFF